MASLRVEAGLLQPHTEPNRLKMHHPGIGTEALTARTRPHDLGLIPQTHAWKISRVNKGISTFLIDISQLS